MLVGVIVVSFLFALFCLLPLWFLVCGVIVDSVVSLRVPVVVAIGRKIVAPR